MKKRTGHSRKGSKHDQALLARILVRKLDYVFQRYFHQSLHEIATEFEIHGALQDSSLSPEQLLKMIHASQILRMRSAPAVEEASEALDRFCEGTFGVCSRCGRGISPEALEANPLTTTCTDCEHDLSLRIYSATTNGHLVPEGHDS